jgi:predicted ATPase
MLTTNDMEKIIDIKIFSPIDFEAKNMKLKDLTILVGKNGTGKSLINKLIWLVSIIRNYYIMNKKNKITNWEEEINYIINDTIDNLTCIYEENAKENVFEIFGYKTYIEIENSNLKKIDIETIDVNIDELLVNPIYASANTRNLTILKLYKNLKQNLLGKNSIDSFDEMKILNKAGFKIYDIMYMEQILNKMKEIEKLKDLPGFMEMLGFDNLYYDKNNDDIIFKKGDNECSIFDASGGEQALFSVLMSMI